MVDCTMIEAIRMGQLKPGDPVPSTRAMAGRLSVSRNTVTLAYQALVSDGFLASRERSGFYVDPTAIDGMAARPDRVSRSEGGRPSCELAPKVITFIAVTGKGLLWS